MDFRDSVFDLARRGLCNTIESRADLASAMQSLTFGRGGSRLAPLGLIQTGLESATNFLNCPASLGPYPPLPAPSVPFSGGQCVGTQYNISVNVNRNGTPITFTDTRIGPIGIPVYEQDGGNWRGRWYRPDGTTVLWDFDSISTGFPQPEILSFGINSVVSGPDDCGDLPPTPTPTPLDYDLPDGTPTSEDVSVTVGAPFINASGNIIFPVRIFGDDIDIEVQFPSTGEEPTTAPPNSDPTATDCCPTPEADEDSPENDEPAPPDSNRRIVGVKIVAISVSSSASATRVLANNGPVLYFPRLGSVTFGVNVGGQRAWLNPIDIQNKTCYIPCPLSVGAVDFQVNAIAGVVLDVNPVFAEVVTEQQE